MKIIPTFHSIIVTDTVLTADQMYIHHDTHRLEVMGNQRCNLQCTTIYPNSDLDQALDFLKRTPHPRDVKIYSSHPTGPGVAVLTSLLQQVNAIVYANHQEYLQNLAAINRSYDD